MGEQKPKPVWINESLLANAVCAAQAADGNTAISFRAMRAALEYAYRHQPAAQPEES